jgi:NADH:ubiquinone oxidoreductase subunit 5 (subunit L)/multisubunit Na+/H+ antiporter MnhA subunit
MEAPVPASSLIHSATLVSAGIYLLLKFQVIFSLTNLSETIFYIGSITACYGGVVAASQSDMKKLLAYSTISHCGFIVASISLNNFIITIIYLYLHGLFKASTFFCAGSIIKYNNTQDMRLMGMNKNQVFNIATLIISAVNLGGLPFTFGYLYKQTFLNTLIITNYNYLPYGFCIIGLLCSIIYVYKLIYYSCFDYRKGYLHTTILLIQNNVIEAKDYFLNFSYFKVISFFIIYIFSIFFYIIIKFYILKNYLIFSHSSEVIVNDYKFLSNSFYLKRYLSSIYYILFTIIIYSLTMGN